MNSGGVRCSIPWLPQSPFPMNKIGDNTIKTNELIDFPAQRQLIAYGKIFEFEVAKVFNLKRSMADDIASLGNQSKRFSEFHQIQNYHMILT